MQRGPTEGASIAHAPTVSLHDDATTAPTIASSGASSGAKDSAPRRSLPVSSAASTLPRTTVLPRVHTESGKPALVYEEAPRYQPVGELGAGGMGDVLEVVDNDIGRQVALKRLRAPDGGPGEVSLARFVDEIRVVGQLEHPNIVPIHDVGVDERGQHYFVMKYVRGETLEAIIDKLAAGDAAYHARFTIEHRVQIFLGILEAVAFAHDRGFLHRDIKPSNVMVGKFGEVVLMDWGIAQKIGETPASHDGSLVGTPAYMSPEQARGSTDLDERSDVYSLCILFWELLTLQHPHADKTTVPDLLRAVVEDPIPLASFPPKPHPHQSYVPVDLTHFLRQGLHKNREDRYLSVKAMIARLDRRADGDIPIQCHITFVKRGALGWMRFVDRHPQLISLALIALTLALITLGVLALVR